MSKDNVQPSYTWGSPEWAQAYFDTHGYPPMAGADGEGEGAGGEGQGESHSEGLYNLESVPEDYRPHVEKIAKEIDANVTRKFQEAAQYRDQWEPYEKLGINEYEPEALEQLLAFAEIANDENTFRQWWNDVGQEYGFLNENDDTDDVDDLFNDDDDFEAKLEAKLEERLGPLYQRELEREEQERIAEAEALIDQAIEALKNEHGDFNEQVVYKLALAYDGPDAIQQAFKEYQELVSNTEKETVTNKGNAPTPPEGSGPANTNQKLPTSFDEASAMATERLKASLGT